MRVTLFSRLWAVSTVLALVTAVWGQETVTGFIQVAKDGPYFVNSATGERFTPFGLNYTPHGVQVRQRGATRLNWIQFDAATADRDCQRMAEAGCNVLRVFLSGKSFIPEPGPVPEETLKKTDALVAAAKKHGIRVIFGGPDWWEGPTELFPTGRWDSTGLWGDAQLAALEQMWKSLASRYANEPGVFAYSLRNEPMVPRRIPEEKWHDFLKRRYGTPEAVGQAWGKAITSWEQCERPEDRDNADDPALYDYQLAREFVAYTCGARQVDAIRSVDKNHLVTNGGIQWDVPLFRHFPPGPYGYDGFDPHLFAGLFDYTSIHWYDIKPDHMRDDASYQPLGEKYLDAFLTYCRIGNMPLVLEEFPAKVMQTEGYARSFYQHVSGALLWEYLSLSTPEGIHDWVGPLFKAGRTRLESRRPVDLHTADAVVWTIDKKRLLTWYADPETFRHNPAWLERTGSDRWHDTGGYWIEEFARLRQQNPGRPIRIELRGNGPEFFDQIYRKQP